MVSKYKCSKNNKVSNVDGATSTQIRVTAIPSSNDVVPVRNQILEIDLVNSTVTGQIDNTATTGVGYTTTHLELQVQHQLILQHLILHHLDTNQ